MSVAACRRLLFLTLALALPLPMLGPFDALVPALRYGLLFAAAAAVALAEGAAGPVPGILALFAAHAAGGLALAWFAAALSARGLAPLSPAARGWSAAGLCAALLLWALALEPYRTPFGRAPRAGLLGVLS